MKAIFVDHFQILVDDDMFDELSAMSWHVVKVRNVFYARSGQTFMHRLVMKAKRGTIVDHVNRNGLDNCRNNLRIASSQMNRCNCRQDRKTTPYIGVSLTSDRNRAKPYRVIAKKEGQKIHLGYFESGIEAARAYDSYALATYGAGALLNFPISPTQN